MPLKNSYFSINVNRAITVIGWGVLETKLKLFLNISI